MGRFGCMMGRFGQCNGPFWTIFLKIKILGAVLVGAVLAMGRFGIDPLVTHLSACDSFMTMALYKLTYSVTNCIARFQKML